MCLSSAVSASATLAGQLVGSPGPSAIEIRTPLPAEPIRPGTRTVLDSGATVEVRWSHLPQSAAEVELLLSLDEGRTYSVRLTEDLDPRGGSFLWEVPNLETDRARLAIRMNLDGREMIAAVTSPFEISPDPGAAPVRLRWRSGEIWTTSDADAGATERDPGRGLAAASESMTALPGTVDAMESPRRSVHGPERRPSSFSKGIPVEPSPERSSEPTRSSPRAIPRRI